MNLSLLRALRIGPSPRIAFAGAGGKTTAIFQLARSLMKENGNATVIVTATSHLGTWQVPLADMHVIARSSSLAALEENKHRLKGVILITGELDKERTNPVGEQTLNWLHQFCGDHSWPLLIEADGSRQKPLKAWANHEPPVPSFVDQVVQVVGMTGVGRPLNNEHVHRPEVFSGLSGLDIGEPVTSQAVIQVLTSIEAGLKNFPEHARRAVLLNQADTPQIQAMAHELVDSLLSAYDSVVISSLKEELIFAVHEPIAGVILAAGGSVRFGEAKQLLEWKGMPFIRAVAMTALEVGLSPVIVVTGANSEKVESAIGGLDVIIARNDDWNSGQGSSIRTGIKSLAESPPPSEHLPQTQHNNLSPRSKLSGVRFGEGRQGVGGAIFLLTDQPQITPSILRALVQRHAEGLHPIVAPMVMDRRANPVLFDRDTFPDLLTIEGDVGGRAIFHKHRVEYLPWHDDRLLLDVDTPEMYQRLISDETL